MSDGTTVPLLLLLRNAARWQLLTTRFVFCVTFVESNAHADLLIGICSTLTIMAPPPDFRVPKSKGKDYGFSRTVHYMTAQIIGLFSFNATELLPVQCCCHCFHPVFEFGNEFMRLLASFRDVSKFTIALGLYFDFRGYCSQMF